MFLRPFWRPRNASGAAFRRQKYFRQNMEQFRPVVSLSSLVGRGLCVGRAFKLGFFRQNLNLSWIVPLSSCYYQLDKNPQLTWRFPRRWTKNWFEQLCLLIAVKPECLPLIFRLTTEMFLKILCHTTIGI